MIPLTAIMSIGEKVLDRVLPDPQAKAQALAELTKLQNEGKLAELNADNVEMQEISKRWEADMKSDSWLSKNIRPLALIAIFAGYFLFAMMSAFGLEANQNYVQLLGQWGQIVFVAYFGGRTAEKIMGSRKKDE
jgi:hypothetical protein